MFAIAWPKRGTGLRILFDATNQPLDMNGIVKMQIHGKKMRGSSEGGMRLTMIGAGTYY